MIDVDKFDLQTVIYCNEVWFACGEESCCEWTWSRHLVLFISSNAVMLLDLNDAERLPISITCRQKCRTSNQFSSYVIAQFCFAFPAFFSILLSLFPCLCYVVHLLCFKLVVVCAFTPLGARPASQRNGARPPESMLSFLGGLPQTNPVCFRPT